MSLETPRILQKLSTHCTGPYPVTNVYKNGKIRIQKWILSEKENICRITPFNEESDCLIKYDLGDKGHTIEYELKR
jgi:hypothetical protein